MKNILLASIVSVGLLTTSCGLVNTAMNDNQNINTASGQNLGQSNDNTISSNADLPVPDDMIRVASPMPDAVLADEIRVSGQAKAWYFEGSFPITVVDDNDVTLYQGSVNANGDWMTTDYVPFEGSFSLTTAPTAPRGKIIFNKSNPSGLPEFDARFELPVRFE